MEAIAQNTRSLGLLWRLNFDRLFVVAAIGGALVAGHALGTIIANL